MFTRHALLTVVAISASLAGSLEAQVTRTPRPPRPAPVATPAPRPTPAPRAALAPLIDLESLRADVEMARAEVAMNIDVDAIADLARNQAVMAIDRSALREMARATSMDLAAVAAEGQAFAASLAPMAQTWGAWSSNNRGYRTEAPEPWAEQDPADSLYREARKALSSDSYRKAADLFKLIRQRYPKSSYAPDAPYWEAFALHRLGGDTNLRLAQDALGLQQRDYPKAATRGDANSLSARIDGMLARRGDAAMATTLMGRAGRAANDGCPDGKDDERVDALNAVTQMDADKAMPILKKVLARREACTQQLRRAAVWLVASRKQPESASILMGVAKSDPDKDVREQAVFWMANVPTDEAVTMLIDLAKGGDDLDLRKRAVYALSRSKNPRAASTLREIALDARTEEELRGEVLNWYVNSNAFATSDDAMTFLKDVYGRAESTQFKIRALSTMASRRQDDSRDFLVSVALNDREAMDVRRSAVSFVSSSSRWTTNARVSTTSGQVVNVRNDASTAAASTNAAIGALTQIYEKASDIEIRRAALSGLASARDNAGIDKLIDIARNEKNTELRKSAISSLSRTKDPRALALLQEIIDK